MIIAGITFDKKEMDKLAIYAAEKISLQMARRLERNRVRILQKIEEHIKLMFNSSLDIRSIMGGQLQAELGLTTSLASSTLNQIIQEVIDGLYFDLDYKRVGSGFRFVVKLMALPIGYQRLLAISGVSYVSRPSGSTIKWLEWLLLGTGQVIGYTIIYGNHPGSRSGTAYMSKLIRGANQIWKLPASFNTEADNNFLTELFLGIDLILFREVKEILEA